ncbi:MAG: sodium:solute symporter family protein, partial [Myxococcota bacterium]
MATMVLAWGLGLYLPYLLHGGVQPMFEKLAAADPQHLLPPGGDGRGGRWTWTAYSSAVLVSMLGFSMWPHTFMRAFSARSEQTLRWSIVLFPTFQAFLVPLFLIGFAGIGFSPAPDRPDQILPHLLVHLELPAVVGGLFCAGALAASMSTGDALAHAAGAVTVRDGLVGAAGFSFSPTMERRLMRLVVVAVLVTAYVAAMVYQGSLVNLLLMSFGAVVQFTPGVALALYDRRGSGTAVFGGLVAGAVVTGVLTLWPSLRFTDLHPGLIGLFVNVGVLALLRQVVPASAPDRAQAFIDVAQRRFRKPAPTATASLAESRRP